MRKFLTNHNKLTNLAEIFAWLANENKGEDFDDNVIWQNLLKSINEDARFTQMWALSMIDMMNETGLYFRKIKLPEGCIHIDIEMAIKDCVENRGFSGYNHLLYDNQYTPKQYEYTINKILYHFNKTNVSNRSFVIFTLDLFFYHMLNLGYRAVFKNKTAVQNILNK